MAAIDSESYLRDDDDPIRINEGDPLLDDESEEVAEPPKGAFKRCFHQPVVLLLFLSSLSLVNYYDRGAYVGVLPLIIDEFDLSDADAGLIGGSFIVGYALASPIMAQMSRHVSSGPLLMIGMLVWVASTALCTFANGFWFLMGVRCMTGVGEAAFICLAPTIIDDIAPQSQRSRWLAIFFSMLPIGYSLGYLGAGLIATYSDWRLVFLTEAAATLPLAILCLGLPSVRSPVDEDGLRVEPMPFLTSLKELVRNKIYMSMTLGYCAQTFVLGALTYWLPAYVVEQYEMDLGVADFVIGAITAVCGIVGNGLAAFLMDRIVNKRNKDPTVTGVRLAVIFCILAAPFTFVAVWMDNLYAFLVLMMAGEFLILCTVTPVNSVFLSCVPEELRGHSMAVMTLLIHLLGDMWSPYIFGAISDQVGQRWALFVMACWSLFTILFWGISLAFIVRQKSAYREIR